MSDPFLAHRSLLFTVAYEMLGSAADAEDVVQEAWLRWAGADQSQVRQTAHRSREHVAARRPRRHVDRSEQHRVVESFLAALSTGDVQGLIDVLAPDVVVVADGGGLVAAARHPIEGATKVVAFMSKFATLATTAVVDTTWLNGALGGRIVLDGKLNTVISFVIDDGRISRMYAVRNPHTLGRLNEETAIAR